MISVWTPLPPPSSRMPATDGWSSGVVTLYVPEAVTQATSVASGTRPRSQFEAVFQSPPERFVQLIVHAGGCWACTAKADRRHRARHAAAIRMELSLSAVPSILHPATGVFDIAAGP